MSFLNPLLPPTHVLAAAHALNATVTKMGRSKPEQKDWLEHIKSLSIEEFHTIYDWTSTGISPVNRTAFADSHVEASLLGRAIQARMSTIVDTTIQAHIKAHGACPEFTAPAFNVLCSDGHRMVLSPCSYYVALGGDNQVKSWKRELSKHGTQSVPDITEDLFNGIALYSRYNIQKNTGGSPVESDWEWTPKGVHQTLDRTLPPAVFFSAVLTALNLSQSVQASTFEMLSYASPFGNAAGEGFIRIANRTITEDKSEVIKLLRKIIDCGIDLKPSQNNESLLHHCAINDHTENAILLLESGHDPLHIDHKGKTPMDQAASRSNGCAQIFRAWIAKSAALDAIDEITHTRGTPEP